MGGTGVGAGVTTVLGTRGVGAIGAASSPVVGFAAGVGIGRDGEVAVIMSATWRVKMASAGSTSSSVSESASSEIDAASDVSVSGAGSLPFLDASRGGLGWG